MVRFLPDGTFQYLDEYGRPITEPEPIEMRPEPIPQWLMDRPFQGAADYVANSSVISQMTMPREAIMAIRPPVPQTLMPPQFGYPDVPLTIEDILASDNWQPIYRSWVTARPMPPRDPGDMWGGGSHGMETVNPAL